MKKIALLCILAGSFSATKAQSLKELLYSGKLKNDGGSVIRKTDDLSTKIDTSTRRPAEAAKPASPAPAEGIVLTETPPKAPPTDTTKARVELIDSSSATSTTPTEAAPPPAAPAPVKSNNRLWKDHIDGMMAALKSEVLSNKKVKKETYFLTVDYEVAEDGQVSILGVTAAPENEFLQNAVKERLIQNTPALSPATDSSGKTRKVKRKYNFTLTKE